jgi:hypothetical protein
MSWFWIALALTIFLFVDHGYADARGADGWVGLSIRHWSDDLLRPLRRRAFEMYDLRDDARRMVRADNWKLSVSQLPNGRRIPTDGDPGKWESDGQAGPRTKVLRRRSE